MELPIFESTEAAQRYAAKGLTSEQRGALLTRRESYIESTRFLQARGAYDEAFLNAAFAQFDREALEYDEEITKAHL